MKNNQMEIVKDLGDKTMNLGSDVPKDPFQMLIEDHNMVKKNFEAFEKTEDEDEKYSIFTETVLALVVHTKLEEELIYPLLKEADEDLGLEATEEHRVVDFVITEMKGMSPDDETFDAKFKVLSEMVKHHIQEEEDEAFPEMREQDFDLADLAERMKERKAELEEEYADLESIAPLESEAMQSHRKSPDRKRPTRARASSSRGKAGKSTAAKKGTKKAASSKRASGKSTAKKSSTGRAASSKKKTSSRKAASTTTKKTNKSKAGAKKTTGSKSSTKKGTKATAKTGGTKKSTSKRSTSSGSNSNKKSTSSKRTGTRKAK
jgi:hypothetical protein